MDAYVRQLPSQTRNTLQRKGRKFRDAGGRLAIYTAPGEVDEAMRAYDQIYARSWKQPEPYPAFVPGWAAICAAHGWLRLGVAWMNDVPIAAQFWFTRNRRAFIFKLAYDEAHATWSGGTLLTGELMRHSFEQDRVVEVDYLTGDDAYKRSWMRDRRERIGLLACNPRTAHGLALAAAERVRDVLRPLLRRKPAAPGTPPATAASPSGS
jgi:GNAT acetyltransferase-like protein